MDTAVDNSGKPREYARFRLWIACGKRHEPHRSKAMRLVMNSLWGLLLVGSDLHGDWKLNLCMNAGHHHVLTERLECRVELE